MFAATFIYFQSSNKQNEHQIEENSDVKFGKLEIYWAIVKSQ